MTKLLGKLKRFLFINIGAIEIMVLCTVFLFIYLESAYSYEDPNINVPGPRVPIYATGHLCTRSNPHFDGYRYDERLPHCKRSVSRATKSNLYEAYNIPVAERKHYTIDHIVQLSVGGSNSVDNLWPEHLAIKEHNGTLEWDLYSAVKEGIMTQHEAVWIIKYVKFDPKSPRYYKEYLFVLRDAYLRR